MNIKVYNKTMDMWGREGCKLIGNNNRKVLGATKTLDVLQDKIKYARDHGVTRIEVSVHFKPTYGYTWGEPTMHTRLVSTASWLLRGLGHQVLNQEGMLKMTYQRASMRAFMFGLLGLNRNILIFGNNHYWLVQASTCHPGHFVGTQRAFAN